MLGPWAGAQGEVARSGQSWYILKAEPAGCAGGLEMCVREVVSRKSQKLCLREGGNGFH